jgi:hypothetical protein
MRNCSEPLATRGPMKRNACTMVFALVAVMLSSGGCVMSEKYEAEKALALNYKRLLAECEAKKCGAGRSQSRINGASGEELVRASEEPN